MTKAINYTVGDEILIVSNMRNETELRAAVVTEINYNNNGLVTYMGQRNTPCLPSGQGAFDPTTVGTNRMYFQIIKQ